MPDSVLLAQKLSLQWLFKCLDLRRLKAARAFTLLVAVQPRPADHVLKDLKNDSCDWHWKIECAHVDHAFFSALYRILIPLGHYVSLHQHHVSYAVATATIGDIPDDDDGGWRTRCIQNLLDDDHLKGHPESLDFLGNYRAHWRAKRNPTSTDLRGVRLLLWESDFASKLRLLRWLLLWLWIKALIDRLAPHNSRNVQPEWQRFLDVLPDALLPHLSRVVRSSQWPLDRIEAWLRRLWRADVDRQYALRTYLPQSVIDGDSWLIRDVPGIEPPTQVQHYRAHRISREAPDGWYLLLWALCNGYYEVPEDESDFRLDSLRRFVRLIRGLAHEDFWAIIGPMISARDLAWKPLSSVDIYAYLAFWDTL